MHACAGRQACVQVCLGVSGYLHVYVSEHICIHMYQSGLYYMPVWAEICEGVHAC